MNIRLVTGACLFILAACNNNSAPNGETAPGGQPSSPAARGKAVFTRNNCGTCHALRNSEGIVLAGVTERWPDKAQLKAFILNSRKVIADGNPYAKALYDKWKMPMPAFPNLSDQELDDVIAYINQ